MTHVNINGIEFNASDGEASDFGMFIEGNPSATDTGPGGMVEEMKAFIRETKNMRFLVDVGALYGVFSLVFTSRPNTTAYAFEPGSLAFFGLQENVTVSGQNIIPHNLFIGDKTGHPVDCGIEWKHVTANRFPDERRCKFLEYALDDMALRGADCMKIDVEGYECQVLRGAQRTITRFSPVIFLENHPTVLRNSGESIENLHTIIKNLGYHMELYNGKRIETLADAPGNRVILRPW